MNLSYYVLVKLVPNFNELSCILISCVFSKEIEIHTFFVFWLKLFKKKRWNADCKTRKFHEFELFHSYSYAFQISNY